MHLTQLENFSDLQAYARSSTRRFSDDEYGAYPVRFTGVSYSAEEQEGDWKLLSRYMKDINRIRRKVGELSFLCRAYADARTALCHLKETVAIPPVFPEDSDDWLALMTLVERQQKIANGLKEQLVQFHLPLAVHVAGWYRDRGVPFLDLIQEGNLGLLKAVDAFNPDRGIAFSTFAVRVIQHAIQRCFGAQGLTVALPAHVVAKRDKLRSAVNRLFAANGFFPGWECVRGELGWSEEEFDDLVFHLQPALYLRVYVSDDVGRLIDLVQDECSSTEEMFDERRINTLLEYCLERCTEDIPARSARIIRLRFGFEDGEPKTLKEVGDILGLSRERVRQLERLALATLRVRMHALTADTVFTTTEGVPNDRMGECNGKNASAYQTGWR